MVKMETRQGPKTLKWPNRQGRENGKIPKIVKSPTNQRIGRTRKQQIDQSTNQAMTRRMNVSIEVESIGAERRRLIDSPIATMIRRSVHWCVAWEGFRNPKSLIRNLAKIEAAGSVYPDFRFLRIPPTNVSFCGAPWTSASKYIVEFRQHGALGGKVAKVLDPLLR